MDLANLFHSEYKMRPLFTNITGAMGNRKESVVPGFRKKKAKLGQYRLHVKFYKYLTLLGKVNDKIFSCCGNL